LGFKEHVETSPFNTIFTADFRAQAERWDLEHDTLSMDQIVAGILLRQAIDSSPRYTQTSNRCDTGKVTVWKAFEYIKCRIHPQPCRKRVYLWL